MRDVWVWIFDLWKQEPIYHRPLPKKPLWTFCGRRAGQGAVMCPSGHAAKIGRACRQCHPGGDNDRGKS